MVRFSRSSTGNPQILTANNGWPLTFAELDELLGQLGQAGIHDFQLVLNNGCCSYRFRSRVQIKFFREADASLALNPLPRGARQESLELVFDAD